MSIIRWEPFSPKPFFFDIHSMLDDMAGSKASDGLDIYETKTNVVVEAAVPGLNKKDIKVSVDDGVLTISGDSMETEEEAKEKHAVYKSSRQTSFRYATTLPREVEDSKAKAKLVGGVIKVTIPKAKVEKKEIKPIPIEVE